MLLGNALRWTSTITTQRLRLVAVVESSPRLVSQQPFLRLGQPLVSSSSSSLPCLLQIRTWSSSSSNSSSVSWMPTTTRSMTSPVPSFGWNHTQSVFAGCPGYNGYYNPHHANYHSSPQVRTFLSLATTTCRGVVQLGLNGVVHPVPKPRRQPPPPQQQQVRAMSCRPNKKKQHKKLMRKLWFRKRRRSQRKIIQTPITPESGKAEDEAKVQTLTERIQNGSMAQLLKELKKNHLSPGGNRKQQQLRLIKFFKDLLEKSATLPHYVNRHRRQFEEKYDELFLDMNAKNNMNYRKRKNWDKY
ncbi:hypothetical protein ACA910_019186 [Epithemia clementina (nom. ined.)]